MLPTFKWAAPPQFTFPASMQNSSSEACLAVFNDGRKQLGTLLQFLPDQEILEFLPNRTDATIRLKPSEIQILRLGIRAIRKARCGAAECVPAIIPGCAIRARSERNTRIHP